MIFKQPGLNPNTQSGSTSGIQSRTKKLVIIGVLILVVLGIIGGVLYMVLSKSGHAKPTPTHTTTTTKHTPGPTPPPGPTPSGTDWLANLYKSLNWTGQPIKAGAPDAVLPSWITWAKQNKNAILQYYVNYRMNTQGDNCYNTGRNYWPTSGTIEFNPVYSWDGLVAAVQLWNTVVSLNSKSATKPLGNLTGFCDESDMNLRLMTLAAFLGNATVESAYFMVCKESTKLSTANTTYCPGNKSSTGPDRYNPRYCNNCDNADPATYSCQGGSGGGSGIACDFKNDKCEQCAGCCAANNQCYTDMDQATCNLNKWKWCSGSGPSPKPTSSFNPTTDKCTNKWGTCDPGENFPFTFPSISTDPCMSDPHADTSMRDKLDNKSPTCSDWNGNKWDQQQNCYFGRGLIQLTWSCNYYKVQTIFTKMVGILQSAGASDSLSKDFISSMTATFSSSTSCNVCAKPDVLCGDYTLNGNQVVYSSSLIKQAIPWLACIAYWSFGVNPSWLKCYSFNAAYSGIAPAGAGAYPDRLKAYLQLLNIMGVPSTNYQITKDSSGNMTNICASTKLIPGCTSCSGGGGSSTNVCGIDYPDAMSKCSANPKPTCKTPDDCKQYYKPGAAFNCFSGCP